MCIYVYVYITQSSDNIILLTEITPNKGMIFLQFSLL